MNHRPNKALRIIAGSKRRHLVRFHTVDSQLRPTTDRHRETLFNWLNPYLVNAHVLDAFAGSGILGFEALSRGAVSLTSIEVNRYYHQQLKDNCRRLGFNEQANLVQADAINWLNNQPLKSFNIIFIDPPFQLRLLSDALEIISAQAACGCFVFIEQPQHDRTPLPDNLEILKQKQFGSSLSQLVKINHL